ncbi:MAG: hypothetical protein ACRD1T_00865 [Acidimicrobiia bacterium]
MQESFICTDKPEVYTLTAIVRRPQPLWGKAEQHLRERINLTDVIDALALSKPELIAVADLVEVFSPIVPDEDWPIVQAQNRAAGQHRCEPGHRVAALIVVAR